MKKDLHPTINPVIFVDTSCGAEFITTSTLSSKETRDIGGVKHFIINIEISSQSHPFYTGKQILVDTARRVEKFEARFKKQEEAAAERKGRKTKKATIAKAKEDKTEAEDSSK